MKSYNKAMTRPSEELKVSLEPYHTYTVVAIILVLS